MFASLGLEVLNTNCSAFDAVVLDYEATTTSRTNFFVEFAIPAGHVGEVLRASVWNRSLLSAETSWILAMELCHGAHSRTHIG